MVADFSSKSLQRAKFVKFRDLILAIKVEDYDKYKQQYIKVLKQYGLYENENDLLNI